MPKSHKLTYANQQYLWQIAADTTELDFTEPCVDILKVLAWISVSQISITFITFASRFQGHLRGADLISLFRALPRNLIGVDFSHNLLYALKASDILLALKSLPLTLTTLDLSRNRLERLDEFSQILAAIPSSVTSLNLGDIFCNPGVDELEFFKGLPKNLKILTVSQKHIEQCSLELLMKFKEVLPSSVKVNYVACSLVCELSQRINLLKSQRSSDLVSSTQDKKESAPIKTALAETMLATTAKMTGSPIYAKPGETGADIALEHLTKILTTPSGLLL